MSVDPPLYVEVVAFWRDAGPKKWFARDEAFDAEIRDTYESLHMAASRGELADWAETVEGALALLILTDQFPRNLYRGSAHAYATDPMARAVAKAMMARGFDREVEPVLRPFVYLPFEHSEDGSDQAEGVRLLAAHAAETGDQDSLKWAHIHQDIIARFGRFPHRNPALGRTTTEAEAAFLKAGGFAG